MVSYNDEYVTEVSWRSKTFIKMMKTVLLHHDTRSDPFVHDIMIHRENRWCLGQDGKTLAHLEWLTHLPKNVSWNIFSSSKLGILIKKASMGFDPLLYTYSITLFLPFFWPCTPPRRHAMTWMFRVDGGTGCRNRYIHHWISMFCSLKPSTLQDTSSSLVEIQQKVIMLLWHLLMI